MQDNFIEIFSSVPYPNTRRFTALSSLLVNQLIKRVTVNGPDDVSIDFSFDGGFERVMEVLGNE